MCQGFFLGSAAVAAGHLVSADPQVRRVARPFETLLSVTEQNGSLESSSGGRGAGVPMVHKCSKSPSEFRGALYYNHYFRLWGPRAGFQGKERVQAVRTRGETELRKYVFKAQGRQELVEEPVPGLNLDRNPAPQELRIRLQGPETFFRRAIASRNG